MLRPILTAALLFSTVSGCNKPPAPATASFPPAADLTCRTEPAALTDEQVIADTDGSLEQQFTIDQIIAGRSCRDALRRVCEWHKERGDEEVDCDKPQEVVRP